MVPRFNRPSLPMMMGVQGEESWLPSPPSSMLPLVADSSAACIPDRQTDSPLRRTGEPMYLAGRVAYATFSPIMFVDRDVGLFRWTGVTHLRGRDWPHRLPARCPANCPRLAGSLRQKSFALSEVRVELNTPRSPSVFLGPAQVARHGLPGHRRSVPQTSVALKPSPKGMNRRPLCPRFSLGGLGVVRLAGVAVLMVSKVVTI